MQSSNLVLWSLPIADMTELPGNFESKASPSQRGRLIVDQAYIERIRELKLELEKTRSQASAARLDAHAAELELRIQRLGAEINEAADSRSAATSGSGQEIELRLDHAEGGDHAAEPILSPEQLEQGEAASEPYYVPSLPRHRPRRAAQVFRPASERAARLEASPYRIESWDDFRSIIGNESASPSPEVSSAPVHHRSDAPGRKDAPWRARSKKTRSQTSSPASPQFGRRVDPKARVSKGIDVATDQDDPNRRRGKPGAWVWSAVIHLLILLCLAFFTLSSTQRGDQIAIAGSAAETDDVQIESIEIETAEMQPVPSEPTPSETEFEISDIGEIAITEMIPDVQTSPPSPLFDSMTQNQTLRSASMSLKSDSDAKIKFCGVEGGGNHFVYLVDSSGSMGSAFESARNELLRSIEVLKPHQRFYVIFFDTESDYMRLSSPDEDEPRSAYATPENKRTLRRWAMTIRMDRGRAPYDALPFAIELDPDVIFLLSDGEFPQKIEDLLKEINRIDNLFGDEGPISIVHTIGYHSREGESRMRRIAKQNGGQYRHVPKP